jgi:beta-lactamase class D
MRRLLIGELPVSAKAQAMTRAILPVFEAGGWVVHGKTGSYWLRDKAYRIDHNRPLGWFIGWAEKDGARIAFARLQIGAGKDDELNGPKVREAFLKALPALMAP